MQNSTQKFYTSKTSLENALRSANLLETDGGPLKSAAPVAVFKSTGGMAYTFYTSPDKMLQSILSTAPEERFYCETIYKNRPVNFYLDIDLPHDKAAALGIDDPRAFIDKAIEELIAETYNCVEIATDTPIFQRSISLCRSPRENKESVHIVFPDIPVASSRDALELFRRVVEVIQPRFPVDLVKNGIFDKSVFDSFSHLRLVNCIKPGDSTTTAKSPEEGEIAGCTLLTNPADSLVCIHDDEFVEPLEFAPPTAALSTVEPPAELTPGPDTVREWLAAIDNSGWGVEYNQWRNVGMALHHWARGADIGRELWEEWGDQSDKPKTESCEARYYGFDDEREGGITIRSVARMAGARFDGMTDEDTAEFAEQIGLPSDPSADAQPEADKSASHVMPTKAFDLYHIERETNKAQQLVDEHSGTLSLEQYEPVKQIKNKIVAYCRKYIYPCPTRSSFFFWDARGVDCEGNVWPHFQELPQSQHEALMKRCHAIEYKLQKPGRVQKCRWTVKSEYDRINDIYEPHYAPGKPHLMEIAGGMKVNIAPAYRISLQGDQKEAPHTLQYLRDIAPQEELYNWLIQWLSRAVNPELTNRQAVFLYGKMGVGKSTLSKMLNKILGHGNAATLNNFDELVGQFNASYAMTKLLTVEELSAGASTRDFQKLRGQIKDLITSPVKRVHEKYKKPMTVKNFTSYLFISNHSAAPVSSEDRRFFMLEAPDTHKGDAQYWDDLHAELDSTECMRYLYNWLLDQHRDVNMTKIPNTQLKTENMIANLDTVGSFLYNQILVEEDPLESVPALFSRYKVFCNERGRRSLGTQTLFTQHLKSYNVKTTPVRRTVDGKRKRITLIDTTREELYTHFEERGLINPEHEIEREIEAPPPGEDADFFAECE